MNGLDIEAAIFSVVFTAIVVGIGILIEILIAKYLIRYGVNYFFSLKIYNDERREIDEIQQDLVKSHDFKKEDKP